MELIHISSELVSPSNKFGKKNSKEDIKKEFKKITLEKRIFSILAFNDLILNDLKIKIDEEGFIEISGYIKNKSEKIIIDNVIKRIVGISNFKTTLIVR